VLNDPSLSERLSQNGRQRAQDFTVHSGTAAYERLFQSLWEDGRNG
jgi:hypothetical protein